MKQLDLFEEKEKQQINSLKSLLETVIPPLHDTFYKQPLEEWKIICGCKTVNILYCEKIIKFSSIYSDIEIGGREYAPDVYTEHFYCPNCGQSTFVINTLIKEIKSDLKEARNNE